MDYLDKEFALIKQQICTLFYKYAEMFYKKHGFMKDYDDLKQEAIVFFLNNKIDAGVKFSKLAKCACIKSLRKYYTVQSKFESKIRRLEDEM